LDGRGAAVDYSGSFFVYEQEAARFWGAQFLARAATGGDGKGTDRGQPRLGKAGGTVSVATAAALAAE